MPEDLVSSSCSSSFVLEYESNLKAQHISFLFNFGSLANYVSIYAFCSGNCQTLFATEPRAFYFLIFFLFSLAREIPYQVAFKWSVVSFSHDSKFTPNSHFWSGEILLHCQLWSRIPHPKISLSFRWFLSLVKLVSFLRRLQENT